MSLYVPAAALPALFDITAAAHRQINFFSQNVLHKEHFVFNKET